MIARQSKNIYSRFIKKNKFNFLLKTFFISFLFLILFANLSFAASPFNPETGVLPNEEGIKNIFGIIAGIVQFLGIVIAVVVLIAIGIKYFTAEAAERAGLKKRFFIYLVAVILIFGAVGILRIIENIVKSEIATAVIIINKLNLS